MKKRILSAILACVCLLGIIGSASATDVSTSAAAEQAELSKARAVAYSVIDDTTPADRQMEILTARNKIIYGDQAWTVDGAVRVFNLETGATEELPDFYDLFPEDWELPSGAVLEQLGIMPMTVSTTVSNVSYNENITIPLASSNNFNTPPFFEFNYITDNGPVGVYVSSYPGTYYNAGFLNKDINAGAGWAPGLEVGKSGCALVNYCVGTRYGVIVSVNSNSSKGRVKVDYTANLGDISWEDAT